AGHHSHQFSLRLRDLVVQAAQDAAPRMAVVILNELQIEAAGGELALLPGLQEIAALVAKHLRADEDDVGDFRGNEFHLRLDRAAARVGRSRSPSWPEAQQAVRAARHRCSRTGMQSPPDSR